MKQIIHSYKTGETKLDDVAVPQVRPGMVLIRTKASIISAGTEKMLVDFGRAGWIDKARQQPDKVRQVLDKIQTDGLLPTVEAVRSKLDQPLPLGYCNVGVVLEVGNGVEGFRKGDRVVSNGHHAEVVSVPKNLCAHVPDNVDDDTAVFTVLGAIALQGIRLLEPTLGECFVVTGLGLVGQLAVQILLAHGCRVLGVDVDRARCELAARFGADTFHLGTGLDPLEKAKVFSRQRGVDGVLVTAATQSSEPISQAAAMCRKRGRIVLTGVTGLELKRSDFYEKELTFRVSCSYGPGRYDPEYEEEGRDYPVSYVRWTEQRNFEAVLDLMASGKLDARPLISHRFNIEEAPRAYELLAEKSEPYMGILLAYPHVSIEGSYALNKPVSPEVSESKEERIDVGGRVDARTSVSGKESTVLLREGATHSPGPNEEPVVGFIGAGAFASRILAPAVSGTGVRLRTVSSASGISGSHLGRKLGFEKSTTDNRVIFQDPTVNTVFIATRHNSHGPLVLEALQAGKHVFVEKPLCLTEGELDSIAKIMAKPPTEASPLLMVGFNRRFAPHIQKIRSLLQGVQTSKSFVMTVNAGAIPADHWIQDREVGGGRILGEACHFVDLLRYLAGLPITHWSGTAMKSTCNDTVTIQLSFADGSMGTVHYFSNGHRRFPKERLEIFAENRVLQLDNFRVLRAFGWPGFRKMKLLRQDKGHQAGVDAFIDAVRKGSPSPIPFEELEEVMQVCLDLDLQVRS